MDITRKYFLKRLIRYILVAFLAGLAIMLGNRTVSGTSCKSCPGEGICDGKIDCDKYLKEIK
jgi:hypothetical protein